MEAALVCGEYGSGEENTETNSLKMQSDVNYEEVGMDMESSSSSEQEDGINDDGGKNEMHQLINEGMFSSKEEYKTYQDQFNAEPSTKGQQDNDLQDETNVGSEYGGSRGDKTNKISHSEYGDDDDKDEYGGWHPSVKTKSKKEPSRDTSPPYLQGSHKRDSRSPRNDSGDSFMSREEAKRKLSLKRLVSSVIF